MSQSNRQNASISALSFDPDELEALNHDEETEREWQELLAWADVAEPERATRPSRAPVANDDGGGAPDEWALLLARAKAPAPVAAPLTPSAPLEDEEWQWMVARAKANAA